MCGCWSLQNLEKERKLNKFNRLQIEVFFLQNISTPLPLPPPPPPHTPSFSIIGSLNVSFSPIYGQGALTGFFGIEIFVLTVLSCRKTAWLKS